MEKRLSERPVGVRKSWRRSEPDLSELGSELIEKCCFPMEEWGDPIEGAVFRDRGRRIRRIEALYANGKHLSIRIRKDGSRTDSLRNLEATA